MNCPRSTASISFFRQPRYVFLVTWASYKNRIFIGQKKKKAARELRTTSLATRAPSTVTNLADWKPEEQTTVLNLSANNLDSKMFLHRTHLKKHGGNG